ncbi:MAG: hypothetical protein R8K22_05430, partial [Mariprofundaceae bacterium]
TEVCLLEKAELSEVAANDESLSANKIKAYMHKRLQYMHEFVSGTPHMHELVELIATRHTNVLQMYETRSIQFLQLQIEKGMQDGDFNVADSAQLAADIYRATMMFNMPLCMMNAPLDVMDQQLASLLELLLRGLSNE